MRSFLPILLLASTVAELLCGQAIRRLPGFQANSIPRNDDGSSPNVQLPFIINFFGRMRGSGYVNNNGNITFDNALATFTPFGLENTQREIIAAFFADVDTRNEKSSLVFYGEDTIDGRKAFGINYFTVGYFSSHADRLNTFQIVLIDRSDTGSGNFDVEFNYERIQWETGDASNGTGGLGGVPVVVGWSNGSGLPGTSFELPGSMISGQFLDSGPRALARRRLNNPVLGRYLFRARNGVLSPGLGITSSNTLPTGVVGVPYRANLAAEGGTNPYRWTFVPDPGVTLPGIALTAAGFFSGTPTARGAFEGTLSVTSRVDNVEETVSQRVMLEITGPALTIDSRSCPLPDGLADSPYQQTLRATGGPGPFLWSWGMEGRSPVPGLTLSEDGVISGTPSRPGTYNFPLRVAGPPAAEAQPSLRQCILNIRQATTVPTVQSCPEEFGTAGVPYEGMAMVSGGVAPWRWIASGALPTGVLLSADGRLSGIPAVPGLYPYLLVATDQTGNSLPAPCKLSIGSPALSIQAPCPLPAATTGATYSADFGASGGEGPYLWTLSGALPAGITLQADGKLVGSANSAGSYRFLVVVRDRAGLAASKSCSLNVNRAALSISSCPLPEAKLGQPYTQVLMAIGGRDPLRWTSETTLPRGLTVNSAGRIAGTPVEAGDAVFRLQVSDGVGNTASQTCQLFVRPEPLQIHTPCPISDAMVGSFFHEYAAAEGGNPPYRWRVEGTLPAGIHLDAAGQLSGTAAVPGEFPFTLILEDARRAEMRKSCAVTAKVPPIPEMRIMLGAGTTNIPLDVSLSSPYALPIKGDLVLTAEPNTGAADSDVNRPDPAVQLLPGGRRYSFEIPPGMRSARARLTSLGTVAAIYRISVERLSVAGQLQFALPSPAQIELPRAVPTLTNACYLMSGNILNVQLTGSTNTRELTGVTLDLNGKNISDTPIVSLAYDYFSNPATIPNGGTFRMDVPIVAEKSGNDIQVSSLKAAISNRIGTTPVRDVRRCN